MWFHSKQLIWYKLIWWILIKQSTCELHLLRLNFSVLFFIVSAAESKSADYDSIRVSCLPRGVSEEFITDFFENEKRSGGGDVSDVKYDEQNSTAIVTFEDSDGKFYSIQHFLQLSWQESAYWNQHLCLSVVCLLCVHLLCVHLYVCMSVCCLSVCLSVATS